LTARAEREYSRDVKDIVTLIASAVLVSEMFADDPPPAPESASSPDDAPPPDDPDRADGDE
jgi:hypothetical protein